VKYLIFLAIAVVLLVGTWWFTEGPGAESRSTYHREPPPKVGYPDLPLPPDNASKQELIAASHFLGAIRADKYDPVKCVALIRRLDQHLSAEEWAQLSAPLYEGWDAVRHLHGGLGALEPIHDAFLTRMLVEGRETVVNDLVSLASQKDEVSERVAAVLDRLVASRASAAKPDATLVVRLAIAAARADDLERARRFLEGVKPALEAESDAARLLLAVELAMKAKAGTFDVEPVVKAWNSFGKSDQAVVGRQILTKAGLAAVQAQIVAPGGGEKISGWVGAVRPAGAEYWKSAINALAAPEAARESRREERLAVLASSFGRFFNDPEFEHRIWRQLGDGKLAETPPELMRQFDWRRKAFASATTDASRIESLKASLEILTHLGEFDRGRELLKEAGASVKEEAAKSEVRRLAIEIERGQAKDKERIAKVQANIENDRIKGQLQHMKSQLEQARKTNRPAEDIRSLEARVKQLQSQVQE
jgi:hypothetical protein